MSGSKPKCIVLNPQDNVAVATTELPAREAIGIRGIEARVGIPSGHKVAIAAVAKGSPVIKYGQIIGEAVCAIQPGDHVHVDNLRMGASAGTNLPGAEACRAEAVHDAEEAFFDGFVRADGHVGTRNYIGVLATVSCSNSVARFIAEAAKSRLLAHYPNVDGIVALGHGSGCCMAPGSDGLKLLQKTLAGYARNPNFGGVMLVGLGCEVNLVDSLMANTGLLPRAGLRSLVIQDTGGTRQTIARGVAALEEMLPEIDAASRERVPAAHLVVGLQCGGSDGYSGITANPALGAAVDRLVRHGGTAILGETPEIYGAEQLLACRAAAPEIGRDLLARIDWWRDYTALHGARLDNNPTPGNKAGGITTIIEKSMGAVAKAGTSPLQAVYPYAEPVSARGLVFMDTPGYDVVSITGMIAGGANMVCFTTGRGTVCGFQPVPTLKLATNTEMFARLADDMDINCGRILDGEVSVQEMGAAIFESLLATASGRHTRSEVQGFGSNEFVPWHIGAVL